MLSRKRKRRGEAEDCCRPEDGIDADEEAGGQAPGELLRRRSTTQESEDRKGDAAICPVVLRNCLNLRHI